MIYVHVGKQLSLVLSLSGRYIIVDLCNALMAWKQVFNFVETQTWHFPSSFSDIFTTWSVMPLQFHWIVTSTAKKETRSLFLPLFSPTVYRPINYFETLSLSLLLLFFLLLAQNVAPVRQKKRASGIAETAPKGCEKAGRENSPRSTISCRGPPSSWNTSSARRAELFADPSIHPPARSAMKCIYRAKTERNVAWARMFPSRLTANKFRRRYPLGISADIRIKPTHPVHLAGLWAFQFRSRRRAR